MNVSLIIVSYNTCKLTKACIDSIYINTFGVEFEVLVVDNNSSDGSKEMLEADSRIIYIQSGENIGFGKANNLGYEIAKGKYLFLLNSDTLLLNNAVKHFFDIAELDSLEVGCWGTRLVGANNKEAVSYGRFLSIWSDLYLNWVKLPLSLFTRKPLTVSWYNYPVNEEGFVDYITGADIFMRKSIADEFGLFDPNYFLYCEETDMQKKYATYGIKRRICTKPEIIHLEGGSLDKRQINLNMHLIRLKSKIYYFKKWNNPVSFYAYLIMISLIRFPFLIFHRYPVTYKKEYIKALWITK